MNVEENIIKNRIKFLRSAIKQAPNNYLWCYEIKTRINEISQLLKCLRE